jgi:hypothetical protein
MSDKINPLDAARLLKQMQRGEENRHQRVAGGALDPRLKILRTWQTARLTRSYTDLLESPRFAPACRFFLTDIYAPRDFSQRDHDIQRLYDFMAKFLPGKVIHTLGVTIELYNLTNELDEELATVLFEQLGVKDTITGELYAEAYRICDNYEVRKQQIDTIVQVGQGVDKLVGIPFIGTTLRLARGPAHKAGWYELQDFLERGFDAFKKMRGADHFLKTIQERETRVLNQIFAGEKDPFAVPMPGKQ